VESDPTALDRNHLDQIVHASTYVGPMLPVGQHRLRFQVSATEPETGKAIWFTMSIRQAEHLAAYITDQLRDLP
jgi:hypothetical protein